MTEKEVESAILEWLHYKGFYAVKVHSGSILKKAGPKVYKIQLAPEGTPDILACINGKFVAIEVKKDGKAIGEWWRHVDKFEHTLKMTKVGRRSVMQAITLKVIDKMGGESFIVHSVNRLKEELKASKLIDAEPSTP